MRLPASASRDPRTLVEAVFDVRLAPPVVRLLFGVRSLLVPLLGIPVGSPETFAVREVTDAEALVGTSERHLDFWCSVGADGPDLCVTTAVTLHGWRGRLYWLPVGLLHGPVVRSMMRRAVRRVAHG